MISFFFIGVGIGQTLETPHNSPLSVLGHINKTNQNNIITMSNSFNPIWVKDLKLLLPCENAILPEKPSRLPNASRAYRNGIHRGIDFFANWGTDVYAVADGVIVRADHDYKEYPADFRVKMLKASGKVGHTPSDIFNSVLLGKAVFLDHGFDLVKGFRVISIYAHLSSIQNNIIGGSNIKAGDLIGKTGNTGTKESTLGTKKEAHLHWELILQKNNEEIYLGKDLPYDELYEMLKNIFSKN